MSQVQLGGRAGDRQPGPGHPDRPGRWQGAQVQAGGLPQLQARTRSQVWKMESGIRNIYVFPRYAISGDLLKALGWSPKFSLEQRIQQFSEWIKTNPQWSDMANIKQKFIVVIYFTYQICISYAFMCFIHLARAPDYVSFFIFLQAQ